MGFLSCFSRTARSTVLYDDQLSDIASTMIMSSRAPSLLMPPPPPTHSNGFVPQSVAELHPEYAHSEPYHFTARTDSARLVLEQASGAKAVLRAPAELDVLPQAPTPPAIMGNIPLIEEDVDTNRALANAAASPNDLMTSSSPSNHSSAAGVRPKPIAADKASTKSSFPAPSTAASHSKPFTAKNKKLPILSVGKAVPDENDGRYVNDKPPKLNVQTFKTTTAFDNFQENDDGASSVRRRSKATSPLSKHYATPSEPSPSGLLSDHSLMGNDEIDLKFKASSVTKPRPPRMPTTSTPVKPALTPKKDSSVVQEHSIPSKFPRIQKTVSFRDDMPTIIEPQIRQRQPSAALPGREELVASKQRQSMAVRDALSQQIRGVPRSVMLAYAENEVDVEGLDLEEGSQVGPYSDDWFDDVSSMQLSANGRDGGGKDSFLVSSVSSGQSVRPRARSVKSIRIPSETLPGQAPRPPPPPPFEPARNNVRSVRFAPPPPDSHESFLRLKAQGAPEAASVELLAPINR